MSNIVITDSNKFENIILNFGNTISEIDNLFKNEDNNFKEIVENNIWKGDLQESVTDKYNELSKNYDDIISSLNKLKQFMEKTLEEYKRLETSINNDITDNISNLDFNG